MVILTNSQLTEVKVLNLISADFDLNDSKDFELTLNLKEFVDDIKIGCYVFVPNTEYGGEIGIIETNTTDNTLKLKGYCWRGLLEKKILKPDDGSDYLIVSGELNSVLKNLVNRCYLYNWGFDVSEEDTKASVSNYQFERYTTWLEGVTSMLISVGYRLNIDYVQGEAGEKGRIMLSAKKIVDYSNDIQFSQDYNLGFTISNVKNGVTQLLCLGSGELKDRLKVYIFLLNGKIVSSEFPLKGKFAIEEVYEDAGADTIDELIESGKKRFLEVMSKPSLKINTPNITTDNIYIGDIVGGKDYVTGFTIAAKVINKIYTFSGGIGKVEYKLEEEASII